ncbi:threonylcarbamoyl-AMP synthase [Candidatus Curtissbacteria bacterium]|nr:threonylcarbamoyl-AMP synthase [Candidatus Curtissbacteria bacterium]
MKQQEESKSNADRVGRANISKAAQVLKAGGIVIFPTDTVYGIGCRYDDPKAIARLRQVKGTPKSQNFPILVSRISQVRKLAKIVPLAQKLIKKYWPGALTIILTGLSTYSNPGLKQLHKPGLPNKIGFRMPNSKLVLALIQKVGVPIVGTSANFHGHPTQSSYKQLDPELIKLADFVIKGQCQKGIESTVIDTTVNPPKILRQGAVQLIY